MKRRTIPIEELITAILQLFSESFEKLTENSHSKLENMIINVDNMESLKKAIRNKKIARLSWCEGTECADTIKNESGGEIRGHKFTEEEKPEQPCIICGKGAKKVVYVARAY